VLDLDLGHAHGNQIARVHLVAAPLGPAHDARRVVLVEHHAQRADARERLFALPLERRQVDLVGHDDARGLLGERRILLRPRVRHRHRVEKRGELVVVEMHDRPAEAEAMIDGVEPVAHRRLGGALLAHVERREDLETAIVQVATGVLRLHDLTDVLDEVGRRDVIERHVLGDDRDRLLQRLAILRVGDELVVEHLPEHVALAIFGALEVSRR
jgi:hypothetical protein